MPPERASPCRPGPPEPHHARRIAESFVTHAERYDRARPGYPGALVNRIVAASSGPVVLDVGCGTGISSRLFQAAGCWVVGIDPDARTADLARRRGLTVEVARFEEWDPAGRSFGAVVAGQAWQWVDAVAGAAKAARVLRPGGRLAVFWNAFQPPPGLNEAFGAVYRRVLRTWSKERREVNRTSWPSRLSMVTETSGIEDHPTSPMPLAIRGLPGPDLYMTVCEWAADGMRQTGAFGEPEHWRFDWECPYTREEWLDTVLTFGGHTQMPSVTQQELLDGIGAAIDAAGGSIMMGYATVAVTATRSTAT